MPQQVSYSWHTRIFSQIKKAHHADKLAHALLFHVPSQWSIEPLLCDICALLLNTKVQLSHYHPDIHILHNNHDQIKLDTLKKTLENIYLTSATAQAKIVLLSPLEALNIAAANALLKTLEAPPKNTYFIFTSYQLNWVRPTLISRAQVITVDLSNQDKQHYLQQSYQMSEVACQKALRISRGILSVIDRIKKDRDFWILRRDLFAAIAHKEKPLEVSITASKHYPDGLYWLTSFIIDAYYLAVGLSVQKLANVDYVELLQHFIKQHSMIKIYRYYQQLLMLKDYHGRHLNINKQLALETLLLNFTL